MCDLVNSIIKAHILCSGAQKGGRVRDYLVDVAALVQVGLGWEGGDAAGPGSQQDQKPREQQCGFQ